MAKTHFFNGCHLGRDNFYGYNVLVTIEHDKVDCKKCRAWIDNLKLRPRKEFDPVPTFKGSFSRTQRGQDITCFLMIRCPVCGQQNFHEIPGQEAGDGDGHYKSHCPCWPDGYHLKGVYFPNETFS